MEKHIVEVVINKKVYKLSGQESEEYMQKLARHIDKKIQELGGEEVYDKMSQEYQKLSLALNLADDYFKCKEELKKADQEAEERETQIFEMRHDLIDARIQKETLEKLVDEYKEQITKLQKDIIRLEQGK